MKSIEHYWYSRNIVSFLLLPLSWLYILLASTRRLLYQSGIFKQTRLHVPVIIVGNISVGGTGKTPLTEWLVTCLKENGYKPGIVSRGYGGRAKHWPQQVRADSDPVLVGDEPVLLAQHCQCPLVVDPKRVRAAEFLLNKYDCDIIVADDGLQHYELARDIEIVVIDGVRRFGNGRCLPAGPLRETLSRLQQVDYLVINNGFTCDGEFKMKIQAKQFCRVNEPTIVSESSTFNNAGTVHAVAGIGNPQHFFDMLKSRQLNLIEHVFPDHYKYTETDIAFSDDYPIIMTEKDAVKCRPFADDNVWFLSVEPELEHSLAGRILSKLVQINTEQQQSTH